MRLLAASQPAELPAEALLVRLRSRRAAIDLFADNAAAGLPTDPLAWVYSRLNLRLRLRLRPVLELFAMRELILLLRYVLSGERPPSALLTSALLDTRWREMTTLPLEPVDLIAQLETALTEDYPFASSLLNTYELQGPGGVEQQLTEGILQYGLNTSRDRLLKRYLRDLVDMRNCLTVNKLWRWQVRQPPVFCEGGNLPTSVLRRIWAERDNDRLVGLCSQMAGETATTASVTTLEQLLLNGLSRRLRRAARDPLGLSVIVEYLWLAQRAVQNHVLRQALATDREDLLEEVLLL